jgi:ParB/RepB/Spo0J family partition protein
MSEQNTIVTMIPLSRVEIAQNVRTKTGLDKQSITELAESIKEHGLLQPIIVTETADQHAVLYMVIAGQRRTLACIKAGLTEIPAIIRKTNAGGEDLKAAQIVENLHRENLSLAETCQAVREMLAMVGKPAEVARRLNKSSAWVSKHLSPTGPAFNAAVREFVTSGACNDIEIALMLNQIARLPNGGAYAHGLIRDLQNGLIGRAKVRAVLEDLKSPGEPEDEQEDEGSGEGEGEAPSGKKAVSFELSAEQHAMFEALGGVAWIKRELKKAEKAQTELPV